MKKNGFFKTFGGMLKGIVRPDTYIETGKQASWLAIHLLVILVSVLLPVILFFIPVNNKIGNNHLADEVDDRIAYFRLSEDGFECQKQYEWKQEGGAYIRINTARYSTESDEIDELLETGHYSTMVVVTNQEILLYSDDAPTRILWSSVYDHLQSIEARNSYDKSILIRLARTYDTPILLGVTGLLAFLLLIGYYLAGVLWGCIGSIAKRVSGLADEIDFSEMMKSAILIRTPWYVLTTVITWHFLKGHVLSLHGVCAVVTLIYVISSVCAYANRLHRIPQQPEEEQTEKQEYDGD